MVSFYKPAKSSKKTQTGKTVTVQRWDMTGQGVCNDSKPVLFVDGKNHRFPSVDYSFSLLRTFRLINMSTIVDILVKKTGLFI